MTPWDDYPAEYRSRETQHILAALHAGECVSVVGLSGAGKSNLLGFLAQRVQPDATDLVSVDCNRLAPPLPAALFHAMRAALGEHAGAPGAAAEELSALDAAISPRLSAGRGLCFLLDRFDTLNDSSVWSNLRALRDAHKYQLTYVTATRRPLEARSELAELFYAHTLWLGPLSEGDARWNVARYAARRGQAWDEAAVQAILTFSGSYPAFLRAVCEAYADGAQLALPHLSAHPAVKRRLEEFWADHPSDEHLSLAGLLRHPLLVGALAPVKTAALPLTAKEHLLLEYFRAHPNGVCEKDDLIRAVWPEDKIYARGIRDDSLAQLIRRLREKIEPDPSAPQYIHTVPGRGYRYTRET